MPLKHSISRDRGRGAAMIVMSGTFGGAAADEPEHKGSTGF